MMRRIEQAVAVGNNGLHDNHKRDVFRCGKFAVEAAKAFPERESLQHKLDELEKDIREDDIRNRF